MKTVPISEFKSKCLRLIEEVRRSHEPLVVTKRGKAVATVGPAPMESVDWRPGAFKDEIRVTGDLQVDLADLGVEWEAMSR